MCDTEVDCQPVESTSVSRRQAAELIIDFVHAYQTFDAACLYVNSWETEDEMYSTAHHLPFSLACNVTCNDHCDHYKKQTCIIWRGKNDTHQFMMPIDDEVNFFYSVGNGADFANPVMRFTEEPASLLLPLAMSKICCIPNSDLLHNLIDDHERECVRILNWYAADGDRRKENVHDTCVIRKLKRFCNYGNMDTRVELLYVRQLFLQDRAILTEKSKAVNSAEWIQDVVTLPWDVLHIILCFDVFDVNAYD